MESLFDKLQALAYKRRIPSQTATSRDWFQSQTRGMKVKQSDILSDPNLVRKSRPTPGRMFHFSYDPKHKKTLPYYDSFPLIIMVDKAPKGFYGLNLHYLPMGLRAKFLDEMLRITNNNKFDESTKFVMSYQRLIAASKLAPFKPCFKHYLINKVQSEIKMVQPTEWEIAVFLPTARFKGASARKIHSDSRKIIKG
jgi:hypothetical protein